MNLILCGSNYSSLCEIVWLAVKFSFNLFNTKLYRACTLRRRKSERVFTKSDVEYIVDIPKNRHEAWTRAAILYIDITKFTRVLERWISNSSWSSTRQAALRQRAWVTLLTTAEMRQEVAPRRLRGWYAPASQLQVRNGPEEPSEETSDEETNQFL